MSQMSSSSKPCARSAAKSASPMLAESRADLHREVEHRALARRDVGLAVVDRHLVGDQRLLLVDAQDRAVRDHAVQALVGGRGGDDDHLALALAQRAGLLAAAARRGRPRRRATRPGRCASARNTLGTKPAFSCTSRMRARRSSGRSASVGHGVAADRRWRSCRVSIGSQLLNCMRVQSRIQAAGGQQLGVRALLDDAARRRAPRRGRRARWSTAGAR